MKRRIAANYAGQAWRAFMNVAFVPVYIDLLGVSAYGIIGIFSLLQAWLELLDFGMRATLLREMARFSGGAHDAVAIRNLLRSIEWVVGSLALICCAGIWMCSEWLATHWVTSNTLSPDSVQSAFRAMGLVTSLKFIDNIYLSALAGLHRQVAQNVILVITSTLRGIGAVVFLKTIECSLEVFFLWQAVVSILTIIIAGRLVYLHLPPSRVATTFCLSSLHKIWRYSSGLFAITSLTFFVSQGDKLVLSRLLDLESFGYYSVACMVASALYLVASPLSSTVLPHFANMIERKETDQLTCCYHETAQAVGVVLGAAGAVMVLCAEEMVLAWSGKLNVVFSVAPLVSLLGLGTLIQGLASIPNQLQLAFGWTSLGAKMNGMIALLLFPALMLVVPQHGAKGAAWIWIFLNCMQVGIGVPLMHRRLLRGEAAEWFLKDCITPVSAALVGVAVVKWVLPHGTSRLEGMVFVVVTSVVGLLAATYSAGRVRRKVAGLAWRVS